MPKIGKDPKHPVSRMSAMERSELAQHYNEFHALIVRMGTAYYKSKHRCEKCPLRGFLPKRGAMALLRSAPGGRGRGKAGKKTTFDK
ncbi:MAG: hypothetical protein LAP21_14865 [Acidobacteriia bacterium]|nr:hypothetical protein [Terriglobia bacterium]